MRSELKTVGAEPAWHSFFAPIGCRMGEDMSIQSIIMPVAGKCDFEGKRYTIRTLKDLNAIPSDKLEHCLLDILASFELHRAVTELPGVECHPLEVIEWIDDGKHDLAFKIQSTM